ncbi:MAG: hypothetical protein MHM6MM_001727 [Cercozoa sp. M6MM]
MVMRRVSEPQHYISLDARASISKTRTPPGQERYSSSVKAGLVVLGLLCVGIFFHVLSSPLYGTNTVNLNQHGNGGLRDVVDGELNDGFDTNNENDGMNVDVPKKFVKVLPATTLLAEPRLQVHVQSSRQSMASSSHFRALMVTSEMHGSTDNLRSEIVLHVGGGSLCGHHGSKHTGISNDGVNSYFDDGTIVLMLGDAVYAMQTPTSELLHRYALSESAFCAAVKSKWYHDPSVEHEEELATCRARFLWSTDDNLGAWLTRLSNVPFVCGELRAFRDKYGENSVPRLSRMPALSAVSEVDMRNSLSISYPSETPVNSRGFVLSAAEKFAPEISALVDLRQLPGVRLFKSADDEIGGIDVEVTNMLWFQRVESGAAHPDYDRLVKHRRALEQMQDAEEQQEKLEKKRKVAQIAHENDNGGANADEDDGKPANVKKPWGKPAP